MFRLVFLGLISIVGVALVAADIDGQGESMKTQTVFDFSSSAKEPRWRVVNDGVMGGLSSSSLTLTDRSTAVFAGQVSLANNGGFASVRSAPRDLTLDGSEGVLLRIKGDGKLYKVSARQDSSFDGVTYQATVRTRADEWTTVQVPFSYMEPTFRGVILKDRPPLDAARIQSFGFLIADKQAGAFRIEIDKIVAYEAAWTGERVARTEAQWRELLTPLQYEITRENGTEEAFTGRYHAHRADGVYHCVACGNALYLSDAKFDTDTGWPSFYAPLSETRVVTKPDTSLDLVRTEVVCARCDSHLGHLFEDGPLPTGRRYCINSASLTFEPAE